jgi:hypothetical protein
MAWPRCSTSTRESLRGDPGATPAVCRRHAHA